MSVRNRCVIEVFVLSRCYLDFSAGVGAFCHRTESDLFLFLLNTPVYCPPNMFAMGYVMTIRPWSSWCLFISHL